MFDKSIIGHSEIRSRLFSRLASNKIAGSMLFTGPDGIGKRRVALEMAQREICFRKTACGECEGCKLYKVDPLPKEFPNLLRIAPEGKAGLIKVDAIRDSDLVEGGIIRWAHQAAPPGCHRWIVIEDAHRLGKASANILLKTLEEPPTDTYFILLTHRPASVLPTIQSRSERIAFGTLGYDEIVKIALRHGWAESELEGWAAVSSGTLKYLERDNYLRACSQIEAWVSIIEGVPFAEVSESLLPKTGEVAQSQQVAHAFEQLLKVLNDLARISEGKSGQLTQWTQRLGSAANERIDIRYGYHYALEAMKALNRNIAPETVLRNTALALT
jgi:DNA polymerase-3 subunit delta'